MKLMTEQFNDMATQNMVRDTGLPVFMSSEVIEVLDKYKDGDKTVMNVNTRTTMIMSSEELKEKAVQSFNGDRIQANIMTSMVIESLGGGWEKGQSIEEEGSLVFAKTEKSWKLLEVKQ